MGLTVDEEAFAILEVIASPSRRRILALLGTGVDHPEDLAKKLKLRRQAVDKQLLELHRWGLVDRNAILPTSGRPKIVYRISGRGEELLQRTEEVASGFREGMRADLQASLDALEESLASGDVEEAAYLRRTEGLRKRYAHFLAEGEQ